MAFTLSGSELLAFIVFVVIVGPTLVLVGVQYAQLTSVRGWVEKHEAGHAEQMRELAEWNRLLAALSARCETMMKNCPAMHHSQHLEHGDQ